jgi:hypothetical protein
MIFPATSILTLVCLLVAPAFSAPILVPGGSSGITSHPVHAGLEKRSPLFWGQGHHHHNLAASPGRDVLEQSNTRSADSPTESPLSKRTEGERMRLVRRKSIFNKIKDGFKVSLFLSPLPHTLNTVIESRICYKERGPESRHRYQEWYVTFIFRTSSQLIIASKAAQKVGNGIKTGEL